MDVLPYCSADFANDKQTDEASPKQISSQPLQIAMTFPSRACLFWVKAF